MDQQKTLRPSDFNIKKLSRSSSELEKDLWVVQMTLFWEAIGRWKWDMNTDDPMATLLMMEAIEPDVIFYAYDGDVSRRACETYPFWLKIKDYLSLPSEDEFNEIGRWICNPPSARFHLNI